MSLSRFTRLMPRTHGTPHHAIRTMATTAMQTGRSDNTMTNRDDSQQSRGITRRERRGGTDLITELERDMQQMMNSFMQPFQGWSPMRGLSPFIDTMIPRRARGLMDFNSLLERPVNIHLEEKDNEYMMTIQAPGMKKEELDINCEDDMLMISGEHSERRKGTESYVSFNRSMQLPEDVDQERIRAEYDDKGRMCRVHLPKKEGSQKQGKGKIKIESSAEESTEGSGSSTGTTGSTTA